MDVGLLSSTILFGGLPLEELEPLRRLLSSLEVDEGTMLVEQGATAAELLLVAGGRLETSRRDAEDGLTYNGPELGPGDDVGLEAALIGGPHLYSVRALTPASVTRLPRQELLRLSRERPALGARLLAVVADRLHGDRSRQQSRVVDLGRLRVDESLWTLLPRAAMLKHRALPLARHGGVLVVGFVDPGDLGALDEVRRMAAGHRVRPVPLDAVGFDRFFRACVTPVLDRARPDGDRDDRWFGALKQKSYELNAIEGAESVAQDERIRQVPGEQIIALMNRLIGEALDLLASDIHIEPSEDELVIRYRIDGHLKKRPEFLDMRFHGPLVSRIKVLGRMDIAERRRAQDGRMAIAYGSREIDLRLATVPTRFGEKIVLRILDPASILIDMERLIPREPTYRAVRWMVEQPQGMVIVAGPTGSGKTTTIYSTLLRLREDEVNIVTIEDPIEYTIRGLTQVQVNEPAGVSFANAVRHFLRQDPDVIVVGETRDPQTAKTSVEAALTGHLVLTSLHANDAIGTLVRLREMGVESFLLANTVLGVVSQRLVRRVCPHCRVPTTYHPNLIRPLGIFPASTGSPFTFYKGQGCIHCNFQGFKGRTGVFEVLSIDERLRPLIAAGADAGRIDQVAREAGLLQPLKDYCHHLLVSGVTTPEEITRVLFVER